MDAEKNEGAFGELILRGLLCLSIIVKTVTMSGKDWTTIHVNGVALRATCSKRKRASRSFVRR